MHHTWKFKSAQHLCRLCVCVCVFFLTGGYMNDFIIQKRGWKGPSMDTAKQKKGLSPNLLIICGIINIFWVYELFLWRQRPNKPEGQLTKSIINHQQQEPILVTMHNHGADMSNSWQARCLNDSRMPFQCNGSWVPVAIPKRCGSSIPTLVHSLIGASSEREKKTINIKYFWLSENAFIYSKNTVKEALNYL